MPTLTHKHIHLHRHTKKFMKLNKNKKSIENKWKSFCRWMNKKKYLKNSKREFCDANCVLALFIFPQPNVTTRNYCLFFNSSPKYEEEEKYESDTI